MTKDQLATLFKIAFDELHAHVDAAPEGPLKRKAVRSLDAMHKHADEIRKLARDDGMIQPMSGGDPRKKD
jgi:hypothetical protein